MDYALALVTLPSSVGADWLVRELLARRLIAGANIVPDLATLYVDDRLLVTTRETLYLCRTLPERIPALRAAIVELTGERESEISVLAATAGNPAYMAWITRALTTSDESSHDES
jgi:uncharacterized protein involved in tolerance to divalent cations